MSRIYFLTQTFTPDSGAAASRVSERLQFWTDVDVTVFTQTPQTKISQSKWGEKVTVKSMRLKIPGDTLLARGLNFVWFAVWCFFQLLFCVKAEDLVVASSPQFFVLPAGLWASKAKSAKFIAEIADLWPDTLSSLGVLKQTGLVFKIWKSLELHIYRKSDAIIALTPGIKRDVVQMDPALEFKTHLIMNGYDEGMWSGEKDEFIANQQKIVLSYFGKVGYAQDLGPMFNAAMHFKNEPRLQFLLAGEGAGYGPLVKKVEKHSLKNFKILGLLTKNQMQAHWSSTTYSLVFLKDKKLFEGAVPSKLIESIGTETPVVLSAPLRSDACAIVEKERIGVSVPPCDSSELIKCIKRLLDDKTAFEGYRKNLRTAKNAYTRRQQALKFLAVIDKVLNQKIRT